MSLFHNDKTNSWGLHCSGGSCSKMAEAASRGVLSIVLLTTQSIAVDRLHIEMDLKGFDVLEQPAASGWTLQPLVHVLSCSTSEHYIISYSVSPLRDNQGGSGHVEYRRGASQDHTLPSSSYHHLVISSSRSVINSLTALDSRAQT